MRGRACNSSPSPEEFRLLNALIVFACLVVGTHASAFADTAPRFDREILPLLKARCVKCHGPAKREGQLDLSTPAALVRGGENGATIQPGHLEDSLLWQRVAAGEMPPDEPLSGEEQSRLKAWIIAGATGLPKRDELPTIDHWAFRPLSRPIPPTVRDATQVRTDLDRFVQSRLEAEGLSFSGDADRSTRIRRLAFDLTGLPPTPEEITAFLEDTSETAYAKLVERYLDSPQYGEHWGQHWLDTAGYAESNGFFDADTDRPFAWKYRDYVIRSINADKPFHQFLREQIAGDELAGYVPGEPANSRIVDLLTATHFLRNGPDGTGESDGNPDEVLHDRHAVLDSAVEILGSSLLGLTLKCARCHDHKFEPVSQRDYYQLQAVLAPAFNVDNWLTPQARVIEAALPDELARFVALVQEGKENDLNRPGKIEWLSDVSDRAPVVFIPERGDLAQPGPSVVPAGPAVLCDPENPFTVIPPPSPLSTTGYRSAFANWLLKPQSRPAALLARVQVNRVWQRYFGRGLVSTADNFGYSGALPTHPELLEWLASEFVQSGWSLKAVHRRIVNSAVYRQASDPRPDGLRIDPQNTLLWRMPLRRLEAEQIRDALLSASGDLDLQMGGPSIAVMRTGVGEVLVPQTDIGRWRRSVYLKRRRTEVPTLLRVFDAPSIVTNCVGRDTSTVPLQSLTVLNAEFVRECAVRMSRRLALEAGLGSDQRISHAFLIALGREPDGDEMRISLQFLRTQTKQYIGQSDAPQRQAWADFCHSLLACNAFLYLE